MSDRDRTLAMGDDLELITLYLNEQLDPEQMEHVRRRLNDDPEFYNLAEPLMFAWAIPRHVERHPRPAGELEKHWDEFTKRAGFVHQKKRARTRRLWMLGMVLVVVGLSGFLTRGRIQSAYSDWRNYAPVSASTGWIRLRDHIEVQIAPSARLRSEKVASGNSYKTKLQGSARFRVKPPVRGAMPETVPLVVETKGGLAVVGVGEIAVKAMGDTTVVQVLGADRAWSFTPEYPTMVMVSPEKLANPTVLEPGDRYRLVKGQKPQRIE